MSEDPTTQASAPPTTRSIAPASAAQRLADGHAGGGAHAHHRAFRHERADAACGHCGERVGAQHLAHPERTPRANDGVQEVGGRHGPFHRRGSGGVIGPATNRLVSVRAVPDAARPGAALDRAAPASWTG
jgi:hypothetical protein